MKKKKCICKTESAFYYDFEMYKCQYCEGLLTDLERVRKIIDYNTVVNEPNREKYIENKLKEHIRLLNSRI